MSQYPTGYPPPPYAAPPPVARRPMNWLGSTALAMAIVGLVFCFSVIGGVVCGVVAVILGVSGRGRVKRGEATNGAVATAGIALGALAVVVSLAVIAVWVRIYHEVDVPAYVACVSETSDQQAAQKCTDELRDRIQHDLGVTTPPTA